MKNMIIASVLLIVLMMIIVNSAIRKINNVFDKHTSIANRVAECVANEYEAHPERKSIKEYCDALVRLEREDE